MCTVLYLRGRGRDTVGKLEGSLWHLVLFYSVGPGDQSQVIRRGSQHTCLPSFLLRPEASFPRGPLICSVITGMVGPLLGVLLVVCTLRFYVEKPSTGSYIFSVSSS